MLYIYREKCCVPPGEDMHVERLVFLAEGECSHIHEFVELIYIESGAMIHMLDHRALYLSPGSLLLCLPGQTHSYIPLCPEHTVMTNICIRNALARELLRALPRTGAVLYSPPPADKPAGEKRHSTISTMEALYTQKHPGYRQLLQEGAACLLQAFEEENDEKEPAPGELTRTVLEYIECHYAENELSTKNIAGQLHYDPCYLGKIFKKECRLTITDYIQKKRMNMARNLLRDTDVPVEKIAHMVGYSNKYFFYRLFEEVYHKKPIDFRNKSRDAQCCKLGLPDFPLVSGESG